MIVNPKRRAFVRGALAAAAVGGSYPLVRAETVLKFATALPPNSPLAKPYDWWAKAVNEAAQGEFTVQVYPGPTFANATNVWERTTSGVADIGINLLANTGKPFPKTSVSLLPSTADDCEAMSVTLWRLYAKGLTTDEFNDIKLINLHAAPPNGLLAKEAITKLADLKGQKTRALDKLTGDALTALGAAPISVPFSEFYQALSRGVVTAAISNVYAVTAFKLGEVAKHFTPSVSFGMAPLAVAMNKQSYERLSTKGRAVIDRFSGEESSRLTGRAHAELAVSLANDMRSRGDLVVHQLSPQELALWQKTLEPVTAAWLAATPDGKRVHDAFVAEYAAARAQKK